MSTLLLPQGIYEDLTVRIPPGTSSHTRIRVNGKGIRRINTHGYGDHYVHIKVKVRIGRGDVGGCLCSESSDAFL